MKIVFAPGCALLIYKPELADKVQAALERELGPLDRHLTCCRHEPGLPAGTRVINVCPGCDRRYRQLYEGISTVSLWELLAESRDFPFPDYGGQEVDLLFGEDTPPGTVEPDAWHAEIDAFIEAH